MCADSAMPRFQVLGADRATGAPRRMLVEASNAEDARSLASERGMLISVVERVGNPGVRRIDPRRADRRDERTAEPVARPAPESVGAVERSRRDEGVRGGEAADPARSVVSRESDRYAERVVTLPGSKGAQIALSAGEEIIERFRATRNELGFFGSLLAHDRRIVVTSRRVIVFEKFLSRSDIRVFDVVEGMGVSPDRGVTPLLFAGVCFLAAGSVATAGLGLFAIGSAGGSLFGQLEQITQSLQQQSQGVPSQGGGQAPLGGTSGSAGAADLAAFPLAMSGLLFVLGLFLAWRALGSRVGPIVGSRNRGIRVRRVRADRITQLVNARGEQVQGLGKERSA